MNTVSDSINTVSLPQGQTRARDAALNAIKSPLLDIGIERATGIVWTITGGTDLTLFEVFLVFSYIPFMHTQVKCSASVSC